jgi:hypothetical protein
MRLKCYGTEAESHEEVQWLAMNGSEADCWVCGVEGLDLSSGRLASTVSVTMRK